MAVDKVYSNREVEIDSSSIEGSDRWAIATASSDVFFPWLLNLLGSIQKNYPGHPRIFVYDLGMRKAFVRELEHVDGVTVRRVPQFVPHWRACYTWKAWVLNDVPARDIYYLDAASVVLRPLTEIFETIERDGCFCVSQSSFGDPLGTIVPVELLDHLGLPVDFCDGREYFWAGGFGYRRGGVFQECVEEALLLAKEGWTSGWSQMEQFRNRGSDYSGILRSCPVFRHDQTVLNVLFYKKCYSFKIHSESIYGGFLSSSLHPAQVIWASRRTNRRLSFIGSIKHCKKLWLTTLINRMLCIWLVCMTQMLVSSSHVVGEKISLIQCLKRIIERTPFRRKQGV